MGKDASLYVRRAVLTRLKDPGSASRKIVGERSYGPSPPAEPTFPFNRYGVPTTAPYRATGMDGSQVRFAISAFAKGTDDGAVASQAAAIVADLEGATLPLVEAPFPAKLSDITWIGTEAFEDGATPDAWHARVRFVGTVVS
jgi:hypothetical protein